MIKIATPVDDRHEVHGHFGHCDAYDIFSLDNDNNVVNVEHIPSLAGCGCKSGIAADLSRMGVSVMIAGNIGQGAVMKLGSEGINVVRGASGDAQKAVLDFVNGTLIDNQQTCDHHEHGEHHHHH